MILGSDADPDRTPDFAADVSGEWQGTLEASSGAKTSVTVNEGGVWRAPGNNGGGVMMIALLSDTGTAAEPYSAADYFSLMQASESMTLVGGVIASVIDNGTWYGEASASDESSADIQVGSTGVWSYYDPEASSSGGAVEYYSLFSLGSASGVNLTLDVSNSSTVTEEIDGRVYGAAAVVGSGSSLTVTLGETGVWSYIDPDSVGSDSETPTWSLSSDKVIASAGYGSTLTVTNNGTIRGIADIYDAGTTAKIDIGSSGTWTYLDPSDPASAIIAVPESMGFYPVFKIQDGATAELDTDGKVFGEADIEETGSKLTVKVGETGVWSWIDPADTSSSATDYTGVIQHREILAGVAYGAALKFTDNGRMTGDIAVFGGIPDGGTEVALSTAEGEVSGTWDGGLMVQDGTGSVTVNAGGTWTRTSAFPIFSYADLLHNLGEDTLTSGMLLAATSAAAAFGNSTVTIKNNGTMTGGAAAYGDDALLKMIVNGTWNTGTIAGTDTAMPAYAGNNGKLTVNVGQTGRMTGNVWAETGGTVTMNVEGTWTGAVKAPVIPDQWNTWIEEANGSSSSADTSSVLTAAAVSLAAVNTESAASLTETSDTSVSTGTVNVTLTGSAAVWNMTESTAVSSLSVGSGTVNFPAVSDASSFTGSTLTVTGNYSGDGGTIVMNTELAGDSSKTDKLVIQGDTSGKTYIKVNNVGGQGELTTNGIKLVEVTGNSAGTFETAGTVRGGAYVYELGKTGADWYLSSLYSPAPEPDVTPDTKPDDIKIHRVRPEAASYATNLYAANTLFAMKLSDRLSGSAYADALKNPKTNARNVWLRTEGGHTRHEMTDSQTTTRGNWGLVQAGGDVASFATTGNHRVHLGLMAGFAHESAKTGSSVVNYRSKGKVSGYSAGVYGTWMNSDPTGTGPYVDTWLQYQRFKNTVDSSDYEVEETYHTKGFTASVEAGYTFGLRDWVSANGVTNAARLRIEGQVIRMGVSGGDHFEHSTGTLVQGTGSGNVRSRVGFTLYHLFGNDAKGTSVKPYLTLNWYHDTKAFGSVMDGVKDKITGSRNFGEAKVGVEGRITKTFSLWGAAGYEMGSNGLRNAEAQLGAKILF